MTSKEGGYSMSVSKSYFEKQVKDMKRKLKAIEVEAELLRVNPDDNEKRSQLEVMLACLQQQIADVKMVASESVKVS